MQIRMISSFKRHWGYWCTFVSSLILAGPLYATTVIPYVNIGEMALASDAVVLAKAQEVYLHTDENGETRTRTHFVVVRNIKGAFRSSGFELESRSGIKGDLYFEMSGDMIYETDRTYVIFLRRKLQAPYWEPILEAYGIFEKVILNKKKYLVPSSVGRAISQYQRPDGQIVEPLLAYEMDDLLFLLKEVITNGKEWNSRESQLSPTLNQRLFGITAAPGHCAFFGSRWLNFPGTVLPIYAEDDGDPTIANYDQRVSAAVSILSNNYDDINLNYSGTTNYTPSCAAGGNSAYGINSGFFDALAGDRWILVMFDDPCDQIVDLNIEITESTFSCEGVLARGGLYGFSPGHTYDGVNKNNGAYGYVVVNERAGDCLRQNTADYEYLIAHEMTHSLGFDHISAIDGTANMNPVCCSDITSLDIQCSAYYYGGVILPVEMVDFNIKKEKDQVQLQWQTAWEVNNSHFVIERSADGVHFRSIGMVPSVGATDFLQSYRFLDKKPLAGVNYYRLKQMDFDGAAAYSEVLSMDWGGYQLALSLFPNPVMQGDLSIDIMTPQAGDLEISLHDVNGSILKRETFSVKKGENRRSVAIYEWPAGVYVVKGVLNGEQVVCERLVIQ